MKVLYTSDLDRTLIFSKKFLTPTNQKDCVVIENTSKNGELVPLSYMNLQALNTLTSLKSCSDFLFVPTTTRSLSQYLRIFSGITHTNFSIVSNGGLILEHCNGIPTIFKPWKKIIDTKVENDKLIFSEIRQKLHSLLPFLYKPFTEVDGVFFYSVILAEYSSLILSFIKDILHPYSWDYTLQGHKLYIMPTYINKESAVEYLKEYTSSDLLITSGDGKLDKNFIMLGNHCFIPSASEVLGCIPSDFYYNLVPSGLDGTATILKTIYNIVNKECVY